MKNVFIGYDGSLRSSGIVTLDEDGKLINFSISAPSAKEFKDEDLLEYNRDYLRLYIKKTKEQYNLKKLLYERAAFAANSGVKDKIAGQFWLNRIMLRDEEVSWEVVSVGTWRKDLVTKELRKEWRDEGLTTKEINSRVKVYPISLLPKDVLAKFETLVASDKSYKNSLDDLSDAYWIAQWARKNY